MIIGTSADESLLHNNELKHWKTKNNETSKIMVISVFD